MEWRSYWIKFKTVEGNMVEFTIPGVFSDKKLEVSASELPKWAQEQIHEVLHGKRWWTDIRIKCLICGWQSSEELVTRDWISCKETHSKRQLEAAKKSLG